MQKPKSAGEGVPARTGGYNYSTDTSQNTLFNQGLDPKGNPPQKTGGYDYSAKGRAQRINGHHDMIGGYATVEKPGQHKTGTADRKAKRKALVSRALKHS